MKTEMKTDSLYFKKHVVPVGIAGVLDRLILHPFDTIATVQQLNNIHVIPAIKKIVLERGIKGFYSGMLAPLLFSAPVRVATYSSYFIAHDLLRGHTDYNPFLIICFSGMFSGLTETTIVCPAEAYRTIKTNQQSMKYNFKYLFRGYSPLLCRTMLENTIAIAGSDLLKETLSEKDRQNTATTYITGTISGAISQFVITPVDLVKTSVMADNQQRKLSTHIKNIWHRGGLFRSALPKMCRMGFGNGVILGTIDLLRETICDTNMEPNRVWRAIFPD